MTDEEALRRTICEKPDEDTPRLVFADWLSEQGGAVERAWATLIRAQVQLAAGVADEGLAQRVRMFQSGYWMGRLIERMGVVASEDLKLFEWQRGFPASLEGSHAVVRTQWPWIAVSIPVQRVHLGGIDNEKLEEFVTWPELERIRSLGLTTWDGFFRPKPRPLGVRGVAALVACPALAGLELLALSFLAITNRLADLLLNAPYLSGLKSLVLRRNTSVARPSDDVVERLRARFGANVIA